MTENAKTQVKSIVVAMTASLTLLGGTEGLNFIRGVDAHGMTKEDLRETIAPLSEKIIDQGRSIEDIRRKVNEFDLFIAVQQDRERRRTQNQVETP